MQYSWALSNPYPFYIFFQNYFYFTTLLHSNQPNELLSLTNPPFTTLESYAWPNQVNSRTFDTPPRPSFETDTRGVTDFPFYHTNIFWHSNPTQNRNVKMAPLPGRAIGCHMFLFTLIAWMLDLRNVNPFCLILFCFYLFLLLTQLTTSSQLWKFSFRWYFY